MPVVSSRSSRPIPIRWHQAMIHNNQSSRPPVCGPQPVPSCFSRLDEVTVRPLDVVTLDGSLSPMKMDQTVVLLRMSGSSLNGLTIGYYGGASRNPLRPAEGGPADQTTPGAVFFVDLAGTYVLELWLLIAMAPQANNTLARLRGW